MGKCFGYVRISTKDQNEQRKLDELLPLVENERDIIVGKMSGRDFDRPWYQLLKKCYCAKATR